MNDAGPVCPRHPGTTALVKCQRCARPTCPTCQRPAAVGVLCVDCFEAARAAARPVKSRLGFTMAHGAPVVTYTLIALNVAFFVVGLAMGLREWQVTWGMAPIATEPEPWRIVTAAFVHGGVFHLAINMFVLWQFGSALEPGLGRVRFAAIYVLGILGSAVAIQFLSAPDVLHVGASGAVFALIAAYAVVLKKLNLPYQSVAMIAGLWLIAGFFIVGISWQGHLGGAVAGALVMVAMLRQVERRA